MIIYHTIGASSHCCAMYGQGSGPIHMDRVQCAGSETFLIDCPHNRSHSCTHAEDAAVHCQSSKEYVHASMLTDN